MYCLYEIVVLFQHTTNVHNIILRQLFFYSDSIKIVTMKFIAFLAGFNNQILITEITFPFDILLPDNERSKPL